MNIPVEEGAVAKAAAAHPPATVHVVDDDDSVRRGLARLLRSAGLHVELFASAEEFLEHARAAPDGGGCLILDIKMPGLDGLGLQDALGGIGCGLPIVFISGHGDVPMSVRAMKRGAVDFLTKPFDGQVLLDAVALALRKDQALRLQRAATAEARKREQTLTPRERDVMVRVIAGMLNKQIAAELGIEEGTIKVHRGRVMAKMGVRSVAELVRLNAAGSLPGAVS
ncbi:MAG: response regulator [bacterium]